MASTVKPAVIPLSQLPDSDGHVYPSSTPPPPLPKPSSPRSHLTRLQAGQRKLRVLILSSDTGGGHRASAAALSAALKFLFPANVHVETFDFWVELAAGPFSKFPSQYTYMAKRPFLWKMTFELTRFPPVRAATEACFNTFAHRNVRKAFVEFAPDLVLSVHPLVNTLSLHVLNNLVRDTNLPKIPYVTVVTDLGGAHPTWFSPKADMTYVPNEAVARVARRVGVSSANIRQFGLPVREDFWVDAPDKEMLRKRLNMRQNVPAVLIVGGGDGVGGISAIADYLASHLPQKLGPDGVQLVVICGKNEKLRARLAESSFSCAVHPQGYVSNMSDWMGACDIICTKAGPGTIAEALIRGLPTILTAFLPGQEEANVKYVVDNGVGVFARRPKQIARKVAYWLSNPHLLRGMSERARMLGKSQASLHIASDIMTVAKEKIEENIQLLDQRQQQRDQLLAQDRLRDYIPDAHLADCTDQSVLVLRLRFMLRVVFGSMLAHQALN